MSAFTLGELGSGGDSDDVLFDFLEIGDAAKVNEY